MPMNDDTDGLSLEYRFSHPATAERVAVKSYFEAEKILTPHMLTKEQAIDIVGRKVVNNTKPQSLIDQMLQGEHGPGAHVCAVIHMRSLSILHRAEMHYELCGHCGLGE